MIVRVKEGTQLKNLLKLANLVNSGGEAKHLIKEGLVYLNGEIEDRPSKKVLNGDVVRFDEREITVSIDDN